MDCCIISDCLSPPTHKCLCTESEDKYCDRHAEEHLMVGQNHKLVINYFKMSPKKVSILTIQCKSCIGKFKMTNDKLLQNLNENIGKLAKIAMDFIEENRKVEQLYLEVLQYLVKNDKVIKKLNYTPVEQFILKHLQDPNDIINDFNFVESGILKGVDLNKKLEDSEKEINKLRTEIINRDKALGEATKRVEKDTEEINIFNQVLKALDYERGDINDLFLDYNSQYLYFFENGSKNICAVDIISDNDVKFAVDIPDNLGVFTGFCQLPNNKLFYYSNSAGTYGDICYIFDVESKTGVKQKSCKVKANIGSCCYLNNCVYSFGGTLNNGQPSTDSERFDLLTGEWLTIAPITATNYSSTVSLNGMILIASHNLTNLIEYNSTINAYSSYFNGQFAVHHVILCKGLNKIYSFTQNVLWDVTNYNQNKFTQICTPTGVTNHTLISNPIRHGSCIYFILASKRIYRFNLLTRSLINLRPSKV